MRGWAPPVREVFALPEHAPTRTARRWPIAIDLFCGCGGLTLGLKQARFRVIGAVDNDPLAVRTYRLNHRPTYVWEDDIRVLSIAEVQRKLALRCGQLDLLAGCPPCQGFSSIRTRNGANAIADERNDLVFEFARFARGLRPKAIMLENVPGLADDRRLNELCDQLTALGYRPKHRVRDAADFFVPQRRRRLILLAGYRVDLPFVSERSERRTVRHILADLPRPGTSGDDLHDLPELRSARIRKLIGRIPQDGGSRSHLGTDAQLRCHRDFAGFHDVYGRMMWDDVAPTITSGCINPSKGRFLHPRDDRAITLREAALLQGFPPDYRFSLDRGKYAAAAMIGNALPPEFVRQHALVVRRQLRAADSRAR
jgi:DNA (cytosine-5)-methyltransferase 1